MCDLFFTSAFADLHGAFFSGGVRIRSVCFIGHTGRDRGLRGGIKRSRKSVSEEASFLPYVLLMTVSYTHLDVYKRQAYWNGLL